MNTDPGTATGTTAGSTTAGSTAAGSSTIDDADVARFSAMAAEWWDPNGKFRPLHKFNPVRLAYIRDCAAAHFARNATMPLPFSGLKLLDIGCGGGLVCEPMARLGFTVVGADASDKTVMTAATHARAQGLAVDYRATTAEVLAASGERFDIILNLEVIEHVADVPLFLKSCAAMLRPGGLMIVATLNRTLKAWVLAVVGAEYVLGWIPRGTHDWNKFITPAEMKAYAASAGLAVNSLTGVTYSPFSDKWSLSSDVDVNYMAEITLVTALSPAKPEAVT